MDKLNRAQPSPDNVTKVSSGKKLAWGVGAIADIIISNAHAYLGLAIYNVALGIDAKLIGIAMMIPRFVDAFTDPIMGSISDNTKSKFGRRRPYILVGSILSGILFSLMWMPPLSLSKNSLAFYFLLISILYYLAYTVFTVPWNALGLELTLDYHDRTRVQAYRTFIAALSGCTLGFMWWLALRIGQNEIQGIRVVGLIYGAVIITFGILPAIFCQERTSIETTRKMALGEACKTTLSNKFFVILAIIIFFIIISIYLVNPLSLYLNLYYVFPGNKTAVSNIALWGNTVYQVACILLVPIISWIATHVGKKKSLVGAICIIISSYLLSWFFYTPKMPYLQLVCMFLNAPGMVSIWVVTGSMAADLIDIDELNTNMRREGMYSSIGSWIIKTAIASTLFMSTLLLDVAGFNEALKSQSEGTIMKLRLIFMLIPVFGLSLALVLALYYPVNENMIRKVRVKLDARKTELDNQHNEFDKRI